MGYNLALTSSLETFSLMTSAWRREEQRMDLKHGENRRL
jgi:hypothetical protein